MKKRKNPAAVTLGRRGGRARALALSPERRSEIARTAANAKHARIKRYKRGA